MSADVHPTTDGDERDASQAVSLADVEAIDAQLEEGTLVSLKLASGAVVVMRLTQIQTGRHECPVEGCFRRFDSPRAQKGHVTKQHPEYRADDARECAACGASFLPDAANPDQEFCSMRCYQDARRDRVELTCEHCGDTFTEKASHADGRRHCSLDCRRAADAFPIGNAKKVVHEVRDCPECGDAFRVPPSHSDQQYCSRDCYTASKWETRACTMCGGAFDARKVSDDRYCSRGCHFEHQRKHPRPDGETALLADILLGEYTRESALNRVRAHLGAELSDSEAFATLAEAVLEAFGKGRHVGTERVADIQEATTLYELSRALRVDRDLARHAAAVLQLEVAESATVVDDRQRRAARRRLREYIRDQGGEPSA